MSAKTKYLNLLNFIRKLNKVIVAFSGGVDSTFLLKAAQDALADNVKAVTICTPYVPKWEIAEAKQLAQELNIAYEIIEAPLIEEIRYNPENRCYLCKRALFSRLKSLAEKEGYYAVIDGTNYDDAGYHRPGIKALQELKIISPLLACKLTKDDIRNLSKEMGLNTWDKPPYACLLTRVPYGNELKIADLVKIEKAEKYLIGKGFRAIRVRCHGNLARIEVDKKDIHKILAEGIPEEIVHKFKECGFKYVTLDLEGYRTGSFDETIKK